MKKIFLYLLFSIPFFSFAQTTPTLKKVAAAGNVAWRPLLYNANYGAQYGVRTLTDKRYVDSVKAVIQSVATGGTGNSTFTAFSVITAGTTATNPFQHVSGLGTSGQVLTSTGAGALPTWQTASTTTISLTGAGTTTVTGTSPTFTITSSNSGMTSSQWNTATSPTTAITYTVGSVGIGTPTVGATFEAISTNTTAATSAMKIRNGSYSLLWDIHNDGNIVAGNVTDENLSIGTNNGFVGTTASGNVFLGTSIAPNITSGFRNMGVCDICLGGLTSGTFNIVMGGRGLGTGITSGSRNILLNGGGGVGNISDVVSVGYQACQNLTAGAMVALGNLAFQGSTTATGGVAIGNSAGQANIVGIDDVYVGESSGLNCTGSGNIFVGTNAGRNQVAISNTFLLSNQNYGSAAAELLKSLVRATFATTPQGQLFSVNANLQVGDSANFSVLNGVISTSAGDAVTINANAGRFRKDASGSTFVLTNNKITASSHIFLQGNENTTAVTATYGVSCTSGSATITFYQTLLGILTPFAPSANQDMDFFVVN